jgi:hypothetical protein
MTHGTATLGVIPRRPSSDTRFAFVTSISVATLSSLLRAELAIRFRPPRVLGTHHGAMRHAQLDYHLDEFTFRFNRRRSRHLGLLFYRLVEGALAADARPYQELISESAA